MQYAQRHAALRACDDERASSEKFQTTNIAERRDTTRLPRHRDGDRRPRDPGVRGIATIPCLSPCHIIHDRTIPTSLSNTAGERLDHYLVRTGHAASRRDAREMVARGAVLLNGRRGIKGAVVRAGDNVEVEAPPTLAAIEPGAGSQLALLFEDPGLIAVNKPGGVPCHPLRPGERGTVMNSVVARFPETAAVG